MSHTEFSDDRVRRDILPQRILAETGAVEHAACLLSPQPPPIFGGSPFQPAALQNGAEGEHASVLLDFGREIHGGARLLVQKISGEMPARVRLCFGESAAEAFSTLGEKNACNDHAPRDFTVLLPLLSDTVFGETGFRFLRVELLSPNTCICFKAIMAVSVFRDIPYLGSFSCDRETLCRIFDTAAYTCHLNMQRYLWDGIKRDRLVWLGDMHPEILTVRTVFGAQPLVAETLRFARESTPLPLYMNNYPTYSLWFLLIVQDWYQYTGDAAFLEEQRTYVCGLAAQLVSLIDDTGADALPDYFLDWPSHGRPEEKDGSRALLALALDAAAALLERYGETAAAGVCRQKRQLLAKCSASCHGSKPAAAMLALAGWMSDRDAAAVIARDGARHFSTFMSYYLLKVAARGGDMATALSLLETYYGGMLSRGATTFWEDFNIDWLENSGRIDEIPPAGLRDIHGDNGAFCYRGYRHSLCHGWASAPTAFLAEEVLGVRILEPGCRKIGIAPCLGDLQWAKGDYPTPKGILHISHIRQPDGSILTTWDAPAGVEVCKL